MILAIRYIFIFVIVLLLAELKTQLQHTEKVKLLPKKQEGGTTRTALAFIETLKLA